MRTRPLLSYSAYARHRGVSVEAVSKAVKAERITALQDPKGAYWIDAVLADREWDENSDPSKRIGGDAAAAMLRVVAEDDEPLVPEPAEPPRSYVDPSVEEAQSYSAARARREAANAQIAELLLAEKLGRLVDAEQVKKVFFDTARMVRESITVIPDRISPLLAAETDPHKINILLGDELRRALEELCRDDTAAGA